MHRAEGDLDRLFVQSPNGLAQSESQHSDQAGSSDSALLRGEHHIGVGQRRAVGPEGLVEKLSSQVGADGEDENQIAIRVVAFGKRLERGCWRLFILGPYEEAGVDD